MTSAIVHAPRSDTRPVTAASASGRRSRAVAAGLSIVGSAVAFLIAGLGLLTVPAAAIIVFGPALLDRF